MFESLIDFVDGSAWAYAAIFAIVTIDAFFPLVPGETSVIAGAILAANDELSVSFVFAAAMIGALAGDSISYLLGDRFGPSVQRRLFKGEGAAKKLDWARRQLKERGPVIIIAARFVPGGRTAATFSAGVLEYRWRTFFMAALAAAVLWASFTTALGWFGGNAYKDSLWKPLLISLAVALLAAAAGELYRRATDRPEAVDP